MRIWGWGLWREAPLWMGKTQNLKKFVSWGECSPKGWPQQRRILIIRWIEILIRWLPVCFPKEPCHRPISSWTKGLWWHRWRRYVRAQQHGLTKASLATAATSAHLPALSPGYGAVHQGDQPAVWSAADWLHWTFSVMEGAFVLTGIDIYSGYKFAFPVCSVSGKTTICGLTECLPTIMLSHSSASTDPRISLHSQEVQQWAPAYWCYHVLH